MIGQARSKNGVAIRLTGERWYHIVERHDDVAGHVQDVLLTVEDPDFIVKGWAGELLAVRRVHRKYLVVVYREVSSNDGFVITAYFTKRIQKLKRREVLWQKPRSRNRST